jgi:hypothetical protein
MHSDEEYRLSARMASMGVVMQAQPGEQMAEDGGDGDGDEQHDGADASRGA